MEDICKRINIQNKVKKARTGAKPQYCLLCGKEIIHICNSHSVPRMVLDTIAA